MATIKRVNLCFDIDRSDDKKVYEILKDQRNKTAYVVDVIMESLKKGKVNIDEEILRQIIKDLFIEMNFTINPNTRQGQNDNDYIPEDVFDIISNI